MKTKAPSFESKVGAAVDKTLEQTDDVRYELLEKELKEFSEGLDARIAELEDKVENSRACRKERGEIK